MQIGLDWAGRNLSNARKNPPKAKPLLHASWNQPDSLKSDSYDKPEQLVRRRLREARPHGLNCAERW